MDDLATGIFADADVEFYRRSMSLNVKQLSALVAVASVRAL